MLSVFGSQFSTLSAQNIRPTVGERITIRGGIAETAVENKAGVELGAMTPDSLYRYMSAIDSLRGDGIRFNRSEIDSLVTSLIDRTSPTGDTLSEEEMGELIALRKTLPLNSTTVRQFLDDRAFTSRYLDGGVDTLLPKLIPPDTLSRRQKRLLARRDTTAYRYNNIFRDSIKLSPVIAISMVVPGFSQFYNEDYWKIPVLYGTAAAGVGLFVWQNKKYQPYKRAYDYYYDRQIAKDKPGYANYKATMVELQENMIRHDTYRKLAIGMAAASYIYFLVDGTLNYSGTVDHVKKATTLATICPGAGQIYNKNYWKLPIVIGGAATLIYCIDWNNRGYQRFLRAFNAKTDDSDATIVEPALDWMDASDLQTTKNSYRRNRDLCYILTGLFYFIQLIDAHATAHMKTYDISDDLARVSFEPSVNSFYSQRMGYNVNTWGFSLNMRF